MFFRRHNGSPVLTFPAMEPKDTALLSRIFRVLDEDKEATIDRKVFVLVGAGKIAEGLVCQPDLNRDEAIKALASLSRRPERSFAS